MRDGKIVETGDHESLMAQGGVYAEMFDAQRKWYADEGAVLAAAEL